MVGLVLVMEWTSVLVIILRIPPKKTKKKRKKKTKKKTDKQNTGRQRGRAAQKITVQNALYHCTNRSENKLTIHLLHFYFHFPLNHEVRA